MSKICNFIKIVTALLLMSAVLLVSCRSKVSAALDVAGENRCELEKVLEYYKSVKPDEFKYQAAEFLISNMPYHYSTQGEAVEQYDSAYVEMAKVPLPQRDSVFEHCSRGIDMSSMKIGIDIRTVSADFLIHHIDQACDLWQSTGWKDQYPVSIFYNYVLPYRLDTEPLTNWRDSLDNNFHYLNEPLLWSLRGNAYEAEAAELRNCIVVDCPSAAGEKAVEMYDSLSELTFSIEQPLPVKKLLYLSYASDVRNSSVDVYLNGKFIKHIFLTPTISMSSFNNRRASVLLNCRKGANTVTVKRSTGKLVMDIMLDVMVFDYDRSKMQDFSQRLWRIRNQATGHCITFDTLQASLLTKVRLKPTVKNDSLSMLRLDYMEHQCWRIAAFKHDSIDLCLDVLNYLPFAGTPIMQWKYVGGNNQKWMMLPVGGGLYRIVGRDSGLCLESVKDEETGKEIMAIGIYTGKASQHWHIDDAGANPHPASWVQYGTTTAEAYRIYDMMNLYEWFLFAGKLPLKTTSLTRWLTGNCRDESSLIVHLARYMGIPSTVDFTPQWGNRSMKHEWSVLVNPDGRCTKFYMGTTPGDTAKTFTEYRRPKVFRHQFEIDRDILDDFSDVKDRPELFKVPTFTDVTDEYGETTDITCEIPEPYRDRKLAYICVFDNEKWVIVHYGRIRHGKVTFEKMGRDIAYITAMYEDGRTIPLGNPYILTKEGRIEKLSADGGKRQSMKLIRKYPFFGRAELFNWGMWGGKFQGSDTGDFADATDLFVYNGITGGNWYEFPITGDKPFRYLRYFGPKDSHCYVNEIEFLDEHGMKAEGKVIGTEGEPKYEKEKVFDGDILTGFRAVTPDSNWVGLQLAKPFVVKKLRFISRNDGNCINAGDDYELRYWSDGRWIALGHKTVRRDRLMFLNVPKGALYLLHDRTKGTEERIFTYRNGRQVWW